ncbi:hypothetical protein I5H79_gp053 [Mycobacterium phage Poenanya]|uniref:Uncharacterized protein n=1 Tax=Mycobacterium phage Poenanya TaxID=2500793 RepID=A0A411AWX4_9CAUD|nr:hypothetical protein I5H79_gp053 [Mycobacterium phage Poenanya]QAX92611.1 hypothetical protein SEA_POENANYA_53 [Mycobacterium phage Poenanya]QFP96065.1 hypothetical protein SEA_DOOMPHIST_53 [Mycobacterium phage Doomphist]
MNLVERLNARFNNVIHDGLALVGAVVDPWLAKLERQAMSNALGRDFGLDYADVLVAVEAEEEVHEPARFLYFCDHCFAQMDQGYHDSNGGVCMDCSMKDSAIRAIWCFEHQQLRSGCHGLPHVSAERRVSADSSPTAVGDIGPGAGMVPPPPAPGPSNPLNTYVAGPLGEAIPGDEFMELGEFLDSATAEELAAMRQQHATAAELERHLRYFTTAPGASGVNPGVVAQSLLDSYRITPR